MEADAPPVVTGDVPSWRFRYVPALDGLRAIAVTAVIALHSGVGLATGGWIGVDVFFVLSGFLITTLLLREEEQTDRLRLGSFYIRRLLRLMPALVFLLAVTLTVALLAQGHLPTSFAPEHVLSGSAVAGTYVTDLIVAFTHVQVGPFLHTWSLAVEEHFYLLWPLILGLALARGWPRRRIAVGTIAAMLLILAWRAAVYRSEGPSFHFLYSVDTQADHLLAGCLLALVMPSIYADVVRHRRPLYGAALVALAVLLVLIVKPMSNGLLAVGGFVAIYLLSATVVLYLVSGPVQGPLRILQTRPFVLVGQLSYALYLWHYVIFHALTPEVLGTSRAVSIVTRLALTFLLATFSYVVVERYFLRLKERWEPAERRRAPKSTIASE